MFLCVSKAFFMAHFYICILCLDKYLGCPSAVGPSARCALAKHIMSLSCNEWSMTKEPRGKLIACHI